MSTDWLQTFPDLAELPEAERALLIEQARIVTLPAGTKVFAPGMEPESFLLLLEGTVRVQQVSANGREIVLYRVAGGESCIMTTACLLAHEAYAAEGVTETAVTAVAVPRGAFDKLMGLSPGFRRVVFATYSSRLSDLMHVVEEVAFERVDKRLAQKLIAQAGTEGALATTHADLAVELGTAREVVSRQLKEFARRGWIEAARGRIALTDRAALETLAGGEG